MTNLQTEAQAIAQKLQDVVDGTDGWLNVDKAAGIIATALAAKDAESADMRQRYVDANEARIDAEAALAEARKALKAIEKEAKKNKPDPDKIWDIARRALDRLNAMKGESDG